MAWLRELPVVVSDAIDWAPEDWKAHVDDVLEIARVGRRLLCDPRAPEDGFHALGTTYTDGVSATSNILKLFDKHAVAVREKAISLGDCVMISG